MPMQGSLSIERMCHLVEVSRAGFYRSLKERMPVEEDMEVRSAIQEIALAHRRRYGYRRITAELRRRGMLVNHKRVARIMREDQLLGIQPRAFVVTTDSDHDFEVYLNLARRMKLTGVNQLWVADITYIRLKADFVYLAVILDSYSRKVVGWALERTLAARLPMAALEQALAERQPPPGAVHHSDRGVQYSSGDYIRILQKHQMIPSMSRPANPYDNASCESFIKTLKREEIYANEYQDTDLALLTRAIPAANSGASSPLSATSAASLRTADMRIMIDDEPSPRASRDTRHALTVAFVKPGRGACWNHTRNSSRAMLYTRFVIGEETLSSCWKGQGHTGRGTWIERLLGQTSGKHRLRK
jgi:transposase InsO family protein